MNGRRSCPKSMVTTSKSIRKNMKLNTEYKIAKLPLYTLIDEPEVNWTFQNRRNETLPLFPSVS